LLFFQNGFCQVEIIAIYLFSSFLSTFNPVFPGRLLQADGLVLFT